MKNVQEQEDTRATRDERKKAREKLRVTSPDYDTYTHSRIPIRSSSSSSRCSSWRCPEQRLVQSFPFEKSQRKTRVTFFLSRFCASNLLNAPQDWNRENTRDCCCPDCFPGPVFLSSRAGSGEQEAVILLLWTSLCPLLSAPVELLVPVMLNWLALWLASPPPFFPFPLPSCSCFAYYCYSTCRSPILLCRVSPKDWLQGRFGISCRAGAGAKDQEREADSCSFMHREERRPEAGRRRKRAKSCPALALLQTSLSLFSPSVVLHSNWLTILWIMSTLSLSFLYLLLKGLCVCMCVNEGTARSGRGFHLSFPLLTYLTFFSCWTSVPIRSLSLFCFLSPSSCLVKKNLPQLLHIFLLLPAIWEMLRVSSKSFKTDNRQDPSCAYCIRGNELFSFFFFFMLVGPFISLTRESSANLPEERIMKIHYRFPYPVNRFKLDISSTATNCTDSQSLN